MKTTTSSVALACAAACLLVSPLARAQFPVRPTATRSASPGAPLPDVTPPAASSVTSSGGPSAGGPSGQVNGMPGSAPPDARLLGTDIRLLGADGRILGPDGRVIYPPPLEEPLDPDTYHVDKGDVLQARVWGDQNFDLSLPVDPDGRLFIPRVGYVTAHARTLTDVTNEVVKRVQARFPKLRVAVTLATPRTFLVRVTGAVGAPGSGIPVNAWTRASEAVARAGGVSVGGSRRRIELHHGGTVGGQVAAGGPGAAAGAGTVGAGKVEPVDLLLFPMFGDRSKDPVLLDGDWLHVPLAERSVTVLGGVNRPGTYELFEGSFRELLQLAGGLSPEADDRLGIRVDTVDGDARRVQLLAYRHDRPEAINVGLRHHDTVTIPTLDEGARVVVKGALGAQVDQTARVDPRVADPQSLIREISMSIPFVTGETVRGAIRKAGGLAPWADLSNAFIERRAEEAAPVDALHGRDAGGRPTQRIPIDLIGLFTESNREKDTTLRAGDTVYVPSMRTDVVVSGYVMKPGVYGYSLRLTAADYLSLAGGETREGARGRARVVSLDGKSHSLNDTVRLQPGDSIVVPGKRLTTAEWVSITLGVVSVGLSAALLGFNLAR